jgi:hypothetical protein
MLTNFDGSSVLILVQSYLNDYFSVKAIPKLSLTISKKVQLLKSIDNLDSIEINISYCKESCILEMKRSIEKKFSILRNKKLQENKNCALYAEIKMFMNNQFLTQSERETLDRLLDDSFSEIESINNSSRIQQRETLKFLEAGINHAYNRISRFLSWLYLIQINPDLSRHQAYQFLLNHQISGPYIQAPDDILLYSRRCQTHQPNYHWNQTHQPEFKNFIKDLINQIKQLVQDRLSLLEKIQENSRGLYFFGNQNQTEDQNTNSCKPT